MRLLSRDYVEAVQTWISQLPEVIRAQLPEAFLAKYMEDRTEPFRKVWILVLANWLPDLRNLTRFCRSQDIAKNGKQDIVQEWMELTEGGKLRKWFMVAAPVESTQPVPEESSARFELMTLHGELPLRFSEILDGSGW